MKLPTRRTALAASALLTLGLLPASAAMAQGSDSDSARPLIRAAVAGSLPTDPAIFSVNPGGAPWVITKGSARVGSTGDLAVEVRGLIIPTRGDNPVPMLAASLACNGSVVATTAAVPFTTEGDATIRAEVPLPDRCLAPVVLLNPNGNAATYIGVTGQ